MKILYPDYEKSLVNFSATILKEFGISSEYSTLSRIDKLLKEEEYKNIVVLLYDGLGSKIIEKHLDKNSFLVKNKMLDITSTVPSTTMAATTSILSGKTPYEHGWIGWNMYFKDLDKTITIARNKIKNSDEELDFKVTQKFLKYESIFDKINNSSLGKAYGLFPFGVGAYESREEAYKRIVNLSQNSGKKLIYAYFEEPDSIMHMTGTTSSEAHEEILKIDNEVKELCDKLRDSIVFIIADHGHVDCETLVLKKYKDIYNLVERTFDIEARCSGIKIKEGKQEEFKNKFLEEFGEYFLLMDYDEVVEKKLFGMGIEHERFRDTIGDFVAIAINKYALNYDDSDPVFKSSHAGLTEKEMLVPVIVVKKKPFKDGVREVVKSDFKEIKELCNMMQKSRVSKRKDLFCDFNSLSPVEFDSYCGRNNPYMCFVYTIEDQIVGFIKLRLKDLMGHRLFANFVYIELENIFVKEGYRGQGVGTALMNYALVYAKKNRVNKLEYRAWAFEEETNKFIEKFNANKLFMVLEIDLK